METFETSATVQEQGKILVSGVPFQPGTEVEIAISPKRQVTGHGEVGEELEAARTHLRQLFASIQGFRMSPKIPREELYDRGRLR